MEPLHHHLQRQQGHRRLQWRDRQDVDLNDWPEKGKNPDGTPNKFPQALKDFARSGPIGLQGLHGKAQAPSGIAI
jgi:hypothetical protein